MQHDTTRNSGSPVAGQDFTDVLGTPFRVILMDSYRVRPAVGDDEEDIEIEDVPGLIASIVRARVMHPRKLSATDLKFIRTALRAKSKDVAEAIELTPEHYSRCESGDKVMAASTEKTYRLYAYVSSLMRDQTTQEAALSAPRETSQISHKRAQKTVAAFVRFFKEMKIESLSDAAAAAEDIAFRFSRKPINIDNGTCGDDDEPEWEVKPAKAA